MTPDLLKELARALPWRYELTTRKDGHTRLWMTSGKAEGTLDTAWTDVENGRGWALLLDLLESRGWDYEVGNVLDAQEPSKWCQISNNNRFDWLHRAPTRTEAIAKATIEALKEKP